MLPVPDFNYKVEKKEKYNLFGKIKLKVLVTLAVFLSILFTSQMVFASNLITGGRKLYSIKAEITKLEDENMNLKAQIAQVSSLTNLSQKAQALGFTKPSNIMSP